MCKKASPLLWFPKVKHLPLLWATACWAGATRNVGSTFTFIFGFAFFGYICLLFHFWRV